eukprot:7382169-Pyramimonas_sp.AAC.1
MATTPWSAVASLWSLARKSCESSLLEGIDISWVGEQSLCIFLPGSNVGDRHCQIRAAWRLSAGVQIRRCCVQFRSALACAVAGRPVSMFSPRM